MQLSLQSNLAAIAVVLRYSLLQYLIARYIFNFQIVTSQLNLFIICKTLKKQGRAFRNIGKIIYIFPTVKKALPLLFFIRVIIVQYGFQLAQNFRADVLKTSQKQNMLTERNIKRFPGRLLNGVQPEPFKDPRAKSRPVLSQGGARRRKGLGPCSPLFAIKKNILLLCSSPNRFFDTRLRISFLFPSTKGNYKKQSKD